MASSSETLRKANDLLKLAYDNGQLEAAILSRSPARVVAEAKGILGPEFSDVKVVFLNREPYVKAVRS